MITRQQIVDKLMGRTVVASISGGKDSAAMSLFLHELDIPHERVFCDTGWEHPDTYKYIAEELTAVLGPITTIRGPRDMAELVKHKGMFPSRTRRFCTEQLKVFPLQKYIKERQDEIGDVVNAVGIRAAESRARSKMPEWEWNDGFDCEVWRPLIKWTEQQVIDMHKNAGLRPNPLYIRGARRVGCWPCIFASKQEIRHIADSDPGVIDKIRKLEAEVQAQAQARYEKKNETFETLGFNRPTFFQAMGALRTEGGKEGRCVPIDEVVSWSKTAHGGKQIELFQAGDAEDGCMRWGLCETNVDPKWQDVPIRGHHEGKRYFDIAFDCVTYLIVASSPEHAIEIIRDHYKQNLDNNFDEQAEKRGQPTVVELSPEDAYERTPFDDARDGSRYPLTTFEIGALASSEY